MIKLFGIASLLLLLFARCGTPAEPSAPLDATGKIIHAIAKDEGITLSHEVATTGSEQELRINVHSSLSYVAIAGWIIEQCQAQLSSEEINYDRYTIQYAQGQQLLSLSNNELQQVISCKPTAMKTIDALAQHSIEDIRTDLDTTFITSEQIEAVKIQAEQRLKGNVNEIGFEVLANEEKLYCAYVAFVDTVFVNVTINLSASDCKIFSLNF